MANQQSTEIKNGSEYLGITVRGCENGGDVDYETQEQGVDGWEKNDAATLADVLVSLETRGWKVLSMAILEHGALPFSGKFEIVLRG